MFNIESSHNKCTDCEKVIVFSWTRLVIGFVGRQAYYIIRREFTDAHVRFNDKRPLYNCSVHIILIVSSFLSGLTRRFQKLIVRVVF